MRYILFGLFFIIAANAYAQFDDPRADLNWYTIETPHFNVVYQEGTHRTAELIAKVAEDVYGPITSLYHHKPDQKVTFVVKDYADYSNGETNYYTNTIVIWANSLDFELRGAHNWLRNVISHEFSHDIEIQTAMKFSRKMPTIALQYLGYENERRQDILSGYPNAIFTLPISGVVMPAWFAEGVAQYQRPETGYESWDSHRDMILRMYALDSDMLTWGEMATFGKTSLGDESSYNQGFSMIRYIGQKYGQDKIRDLSYNLSSLGRMTIDGAVEKTFNKTGTQFYDEWKNFLVKDYVSRVADIKKHLVIGDTVETVGFANLFPQFTHDGSKILYISNKTSDYFSGLTFLYDIKAKKDSLVLAPVSGRPLFSPDNTEIVFAKREPLDTHESTFLDTYTYNTASHNTVRQTEEFRAHSPVFTPDGKHIVYVTNYDGTQNMWVQDVRSDEQPIAHTPKHQITSFISGEQIYNPLVTSDGKAIVFDYSLNDNRSIAVIDTDGKNFRTLLSGKFDYRSAAFTPGENKIYFSCDSNGIFNIYSADWNKSDHTITLSTVRQMTNVLGGAFYPSVDSAGDIAYALYTSTGFKLALLKRHVLDSLTAGVDLGQYHYYYPDTAFAHLADSLPAANEHPLIAKGDSDFYKPIDWEHLRNYNDMTAPDLPSSSYKSIFTTLFVIPLLRVDTYNKSNTGAQDIKLGALFTSSDVTGRLGVLAGGMTNSLFEYDLFAVLTFHDRIPLLWQIGITPEFSLGIYNSQRTTNGNIPIPTNVPIPPYVDTVQTGVGVTYNFLTFDISAQNHIFNAAHTLLFDFNHTSYNSALGSFRNPQNGQLITEPSTQYLYMNTFTGAYQFKGIAPSSTEEINPVGRSVTLSVAQNWNNVADTLVVSDNGLPIWLYLPYSYVTTSLTWQEHFQLPLWTHTLSFTIHSDVLTGGGIDAFNPRAHALFDSYIGGMIGMQGYPFYALGGSRTAYIKAIYRFPVSDHLDFRFLPIYFDKMYIGVFGDFGNAWNGDLTSSVFKSFKKDIGAELRIDAFMWYNVPTKFFFNAAYGLDNITNTFYISNNQAPQTVTYGKQWLFYGGIGFDFPD